VKMLTPQEYADQHDDFIANYRRTGEARIIGTGREVTAMRKDGSTFPIDLAVGESQEGDTTFFVGIIRDITERKEAEQAIARSEARYRTITETCPDAILIHVEGRLRFANTAAAHMFGAASPDELTGKHIVDDLTHPDDRGTLESYREQILRGEKVERVPIRRLRLDGSTFDSVGAGALTEYDGEQAVVFIFSEIETQPRDPGWSV